MKQSTLKVLAIAFLMCMALSSCELFGNCKTCELVTTTNGVETARGPGLLSCGDDLADKESYSESIGSIYTYYDCQ